MGHRTNGRRPLLLTDLTDAIDQLLRPTLAKGGGDVWLDAVLVDGYVIGYRAGAAGVELASEWLRGELALLWPGHVASIQLRAYTGREM